MVIIGGYHKEGTVTDQATGRSNHYDSVELFCFADKWADHIGLDDTDYIRFGTPVKVIKVPTAIIVSALGLPFGLGESSRAVLKRFDFENKLVGGKFLPVYNDKGKVESCSFSFVDGSSASISLSTADGASIENTTLTAETTPENAVSADDKSTDKKTSSKKST